MKPLLSFILLFSFISATQSQTAQPVTLKQMILNQLKTTHNKEEWFVPLNVAIEGITPEQANWKEKGADHSIAELTTHIIFWNEKELKKFMDLPEDKFSGNNEETFSAVDKNTWPAIVKKADSLMLSWEKAIEAADETKLSVSELSEFKCVLINSN